MIPFFSHKKKIANPKKQQITSGLVLSIVLFFMFSMTACSDNVSENTLFGYDRGKKTFKLQTNLKLQKYTDGTGYRYESINSWGIGNRNTRKTHRISWLNSDYSMRRSEKKEQNNQDAVLSLITRDADVIRVTKDLQGKTIFDRSIEVKGPIYIDLLPEMYGAQLKEKGASKTYPILNDRTMQISELEVRCLGPQTIKIGETNREVTHYQIQAISSPDEYDNYFVDPKTMQILQISFGDIRFVIE